MKRFDSSKWITENKHGKTLKESSISRLKDKVKDMSKEDFITLVKKVGDLDKWKNASKGKFDDGTPIRPFSNAGDRVEVIDNNFEEKEAEKYLTPLKEGTEGIYLIFDKSNKLVNVMDSGKEDLNLQKSIEAKGEHTLHWDTRFADGGWDTSQIMSKYKGKTKEEILKDTPGTPEDTDAQKHLKQIPVDKPGSEYNKRGFGAGDLKEAASQLGYLEEGSKQGDDDWESKVIKGDRPTDDAYWEKQSQEYNEEVDMFQKIENGVNAISGGGRRHASVSNEANYIRIKFSYMREEFGQEEWDKMLNYLTGMGWEINDKYTDNYYEANYDREEPAEAVPTIYLQK